MIDLHSHILPGIDDGAKDMATAVKMARMAVADGTQILACTPHILPLRYENNSTIIKQSMLELQRELKSQKIELKLVIGADIHINHNLIDWLNDGTAPTLNDTRYFLFEPPHHILPPNIDKFCQKVMANGYIPILTHPERLTWIENHYDVMAKLDEIGVVIQLTAGSITGKFGDRARTWANHLLEEGRVDIIASDAHDPQHRTPVLSEAKSIIEKSFDTETANRMLLSNPRKILNDEDLPRKIRTPTSKTPQKTGIMSLLKYLKN